jgi:hypothetical protein
MLIYSIYSYKSLHKISSYLYIFISLRFHIIIYFIYYYQFIHCKVLLFNLKTIETKIQDSTSLLYLRQISF